MGSVGCAVTITEFLTLDISSLKWARRRLPPSPPAAAASTDFFEFLYLRHPTNSKAAKPIKARATVMDTPTMAPVLCENLFRERISC